MASAPKRALEKTWHHQTGVFQHHPPHTSHHTAPPPPQPPLLPTGAAVPLIVPRLVLSADHVYSNLFGGSLCAGPGPTQRHVRLSTSDSHARGGERCVSVLRQENYRLSAAPLARRVGSSLQREHVSKPLVVRRGGVSGGGGSGGGGEGTGGCAGRAVHALCTLTFVHDGPMLVQRRVPAA